MSQPVFDIRLAFFVPTFGPLSSRIQARESWSSGSTVSVPVPKIRKASFTEPNVYQLDRQEVVGVTFISPRPILHAHTLMF